MEFLCDPAVTGLEEEEVVGGPGGNGTAKVGKTLLFKSYGAEAAGGEADVLRLEWRTKYACESVEGEGPGKRGSWGFFTWFLIM